MWLGQAWLPVSVRIAEVSMSKCYIIYNLYVIMHTKHDPM